MSRGSCSPWWHGKFKARGFRMTLPRQEIFDVLSSAESHLSAEDIYLNVHKKYPGVGLTTVYRTLELLISMGLIRRFDFGDGRGRYQLAEGPKGKVHHHHLVCSGCGKAIDYNEFIDDEKELLSKVGKDLSKKYNFKILEHELTFFGLCEKCKKNE